MASPLHLQPCRTCIGAWSREDNRPDLPFSLPPASSIALAVAAVAIVPIATAIFEHTCPHHEAVRAPWWFAEAAPRLEAGQVVLAYPAPFTLIQSAMAWQAIDLLRFAQVGGGGPGGVPMRAGKERPGLEVISAASFSLVGPPAATPANIEAIREALAGWGVTIVVVPDPTGVPRYDQGTDPAAALGLFALAIGRPPQFTDDAWVWADVQSPGPSLVTSLQAFDRCTGVPLGGGASGNQLTSCVIAKSHPRS